MKRLVASLAAGVVLAACGPTPDERVAEQLTQSVQAAAARPNRLVALRDLSAVSWDRAEVFGPYTLDTSLPEKLKHDARVAAIGIGGRDDVTMLVLWDHQSPAAVLAVPRGTVDLSTIGRQPFYRTDCLALGSSVAPQIALKANC